MINATQAASAAELRQTLAKAKAGSRRLGILIVALAVAIGGAVTWYLRPRPTDAGPQYVTAIVEKGALEVKVTATGEVQPMNEVSVGTEISGIIDTVRVDFNASVVPGQLLATINTEKLTAQANQARAALEANTARRAQVEATLTEGRLQLERLKQVRELSGGRVPSQQELDAQQAIVARAEADLVGAQAQIQQSQATLDAIKTDLRRAEVRSPIRGVVLDRQVAPGQTVAATFQTPTLFRIAEDLTRMKLVIDVDEADVGAVQVGQPATFRVDAHPTRVFDSKVLEVRSAPKTSNGVVTYQAVLTVDNRERLLKPGMTATADIVVAQAVDAVLVPNAALRFSPPLASSNTGRLSLAPPPSRRVTSDERAPRVWTLANNGLSSIEVRLGPSDGQFTQIFSDAISPGAAVVIDVAESRN